MINITESFNFDCAIMSNNTAAPIDYQREYVQSVARALREFSFVMQSSQHVIAFIGILCNLFVIQRLHIIIKERPCLNPAYYLLAMCFADLFCLLFLVTYAHTTSFVFRYFPIELHAVFCKISMFAIHVATAFGLWCWIVLSLHRYVAVFHPCRFRERAWYVRPMNSLCVILFLSVTIETWLLLATTASDLSQPGGTRHDCVENDMNETIVLIMQLVELVATFAIPAGGLIYFDFAVRRYQGRQYYTSRAAARSFAMNTSMKETEFVKHLKSDASTSSAHNFVSQERKASPPTEQLILPLSSTLPCTPIDETFSQSINHICISPVRRECPVSSPTVGERDTTTRLYTHSTVHRARRARKALIALKRYIRLTALDLLLITPHVCMRFMHVFGWLDRPGPLRQHVTWLIVTTICSNVGYLLYYTQFSINILFLWVLYRENIVRTQYKPSK